ncbi:hypothetical protein [Niveibacterium sp. SC-1]|uniref:hypothetical protein n=1 Tax=Niveibacterium sp. SC-1 TaxID=3135646 RepID=UPI00311F2949
MLSETRFRRLVFLSALYDLVVTLPFATPWSVAFVRGQLSQLNQILGGSPLAPLDVLPTLFACLMGSIVIVWSVLRLSDPQPRFGRFDAATRALFSTWMLWALMHADLPLLWLFLIPESGFAIAQALPIRTTRREQSEPGRGATTMHA